MFMSAKLSECLGLPLAPFFSTVIARGLPSGAGSSFAGFDSIPRDLRELFGLGFPIGIICTFNDEERFLRRPYLGQFGCQQ